MIPSKQIETIVPQHFHIADIGNETDCKLCASALTEIVGDVSHRVLSGVFTAR